MTGPGFPATLARMADFSIREATAADVDALLDVYEAVAAEGRWIAGEAPIDRVVRREQRLHILASPDAVTFLVEADGRAIGDLGMTVQGGRAELGMAILDGYRGRGIGSALMERAISWARARNLDKIALQVWPHNVAAIALYEKFGFEQEGHLRKHYRRRNGDAWDAIQMGLLLK